MNVYISNTLPGHEGAWELLRQCAGLDALPPIAREAGGKPFFPDRPNLRFNLSHSGPYSLCALGTTPVGVDVQIIKDRWHKRLPARVCAPEQLRWLEGQPDPRRAFTLLWCLKEARVKYDGAGLRGDIRAIPVPLPVPGQSLYSMDGLWFRVYEGADHFAAVCGEEPPPEHLKWV